MILVSDTGQNYENKMKIIVLLLAFVAFTNALVGVGPLVYSSLTGATITGKN